MIRLRAEDTKEGMPKTIPMAITMRDMLSKMPNRGSSEFVFLYHGKPFRDIREGLKAACKVSNIIYGQSKKKGFVFKDLRHCFSTYARRAGVPRNVIMAIMGHSTGGDMIARYDLIEDSDLLKAIDLIDKEFSKNLDQNLDQEASPGD